MQLPKHRAGSAVPVLAVVAVTGAALAAVVMSPREGESIQVASERPTAASLRTVVVAPPLGRDTLRTQPTFCHDCAAPARPAGSY